jgi:hypothetical protein
VEGERSVPDGVHTSVHAMQQASLRPPLGPSLRDTDANELTTRDQSMLGSGDLRNTVVLGSTVRFATRSDVDRTVGAH